MSKKNQDKESKSSPRKLPRVGAIKDEELIMFGILIALVGLVVILGVFVSHYIDNEGNASDQTQSERENGDSQVLTSHQTATNSGFSVSISNVTENDKKDPAFTIPDTQTMLILNLSITNKTDQDQDFLPVNNLFVRTQNGDYSPMHPSVFVKKQIEGGVIKPGETYSGEVSFAVLKTESKPLLYVDPGWDNRVPVVFDVLH